jgi:hypothetical protein
MIYFPQVRAREVLTICGGSSDHHEMDVRVQGQPWILSPPVKSESDFADSVFDLFRNAAWFTCAQALAIVYLRFMIHEHIDAQIPHVFYGTPVFT